MSRVRGWRSSVNCLRDAAEREKNGPNRAPPNATIRLHALTEPEIIQNAALFEVPYGSPRRPMMFQKLLRVFQSNDADASLTRTSVPYKTPLERNSFIAARTPRLS